MSPFYYCFSFLYRQFTPYCLHPGRTAPTSLPLLCHWAPETSNAPHACTALDLHPPSTDEKTMQLQFPLCLHELKGNLTIYPQNYQMSQLIGP